MSSVRALLIALMLMPYVVQAQPTNAPATGPVFAVGYVEVQAKEAEGGRTALARYGAALERQPGCLATELFAEMGRAGHFAVLETWLDQAAFDARDPAAKRQRGKRYSQSASATTTSGPTKR